MNNQNIFYNLVGGFTLGILISSFFKMGFSFFILLLVLSGILFVFGRFFSRPRSIIILISIFILSFSLGILRYEIKEVRKNNESITIFIGEKIVMEGVISEELSIKDNGARLTVTSDLVLFSSKAFEINEKILVSTGLFPEFKYGDRVKVAGKLEKPENFLTDNDKNFDYVNYLAKEDVFYQISFAQVEIISRGNGSFIKNILFNFKNEFIRKLNILIKEPESSLLGGLLLGAKNSLGSDLQADFRLAGVSHIVALSGYNITIVAESIMMALAFLPKAFSLSFGILGIILFAIMTGGTATVVRASVMALLVLLARSTGRTYDMTRALLLAGVFMLIQNPKILVFDISFQLSFLATLALILVSPLVEKKLSFVTDKYKLRELLVATISTQIFVLPFLLYKMGLFSVYALVANLLILPLIPAVMLFGFLAGTVAFASVFFATPIAFVCSLLLSYMLKVIEIVAGLPFSSLTIKNFPISLVILAYLIFFIIFWRLRKDSRQSSNLH